MSNTSLLKSMSESFKSGGIEIAYNFPGFNSHTLFDYFDNETTSTNEKIAYEMAWGSSQAGTPSLVTFKNVGLNDAADPFINSMLTGVGAGLVLVVFDDIELEGSQCILDSRHYFNFYGGLWLEPFDHNSAIVLAKVAPHLSRIFDIPVVIRLTNCSVQFKNQDSKISIDANRIIKLATKWSDNHLSARNVEPIVHPINGDAQRRLIADKNKALQKFANELHALVNPQGLRGSVYCGHTGNDATSHVLSLPAPKVDCKNISTVSEVGESVVARQLELQDRLASFTHNNVGYNPKNANTYIVTKRYERLFRLLKPEYEFITGDLGEYTKDSDNTVTHCLCFGSSTAVAIGMILANKKALAITGDGSFYHSAKNAIAEAKVRGIPLKIVLIDNNGSQGTGGQKIPGLMPNYIEVMQVDFDAINDEELKKIVHEFNSRNDSIILKVNHKA